MEAAIKVMSVVGNPKAGSRTLDVANEVARQVADRFEHKGLRVQLEVVDLATLGAGLMDWENRDAGEAVARACAADVLIVASPTYKATYTGLLKLFLDRIPQNGLGGRVAIPVMVAAAAIHGLAGEIHLRPVLVELSAIVPTRTFFVLESQLGELPAAVGKWLSGAEGPLLSSISNRIGQ
jgi:FMN reductase